MSFSSEDDDNSNRTSDDYNDDSSNHTGDDSDDVYYNMPMDYENYEDENENNTSNEDNDSYNDTYNNYDYVGNFTNSEDDGNDDDNDDNITSYKYDDDYNDKYSDDNEDSNDMSDTQSSSSSVDGENWLDYYHTSDEDDEELDVLTAAPAVSIKKETRQLHTGSVTGLDQQMLHSSDQSNSQLVATSCGQLVKEAFVEATGNSLSGSMNTFVQVNLTQQQFGDVTVEKATHVNQSFGGRQNISKTATINEGQKEKDDSKADLIMKRTINRFQAWNQGMVRTAALDQVLDKLNSGTTWVTIKGHPGEGKTTVGYMALEELHRCDRQVFEVRSPDEFTDIIETCSRPVIMLDDVFGNLELDQAEWAKWKRTISTLLKEREHRSHEKEHKTSKMDVTIILIGRDYVLNSASFDLDRLSDFFVSDKHVVYMDRRMTRSNEEKRAIWETISRSSGVDLDRKTVDDILRIDVPHGFPHICRLFTTIYKENKVKNAVEFFKKPLGFLNESLSNLLRDTNKVFLFKEMVKGGGKTSIRELKNLDPTYITTQTAKSLVGTYIKDEMDYFVFDHPLIYDSVAFHMWSLDKEFVIQQCHLTFIHERVRIRFSQDMKSINNCECSLDVNSSYADDLAARFATEIMAQNFVHVLSHQAFTDRTFVGKVMSRIKTPLTSLLQMTDKEYNDATFLSLLPSSKSPELLKYIDNCQDITLTEDDEKVILFWTCALAASDVVTYISNTKTFDINVRFDFDETPLMIAAETKNASFVQQILSLSPDLCAKNHCSKTAFHYFCQNGLVSIMTTMIDNGIDIDVQDMWESTPLYYACEYNQLEAVKLLIDKGARVDDKSFRIACRVGNHDMVGLLIEKGERVDEISLAEACTEGNLHIIELLFEKDNKLCAKDILESSLSVAISGGKVDLMKVLVDKGASVNTSDSQIPPLHAACFYKQPQAVQWLLQQGADIQSRYWRGDTALHRAVWSESKECVDLLLKAGATVDIENTEGNTALHISALVSHKECVDLLLKAGATVNIQNKEGDTALHIAAETGTEECVDLLLKSGGTVDIQNKEGDTALHLAAGRRSKEFVDLLVTAGTSVNIQNKDGNTALHKAAGRRSKECVYLLVKANATVDIQNNEDNTALHLAAGRRSKKCVNLLLKAGATVDIQNIKGDTALHRAARRRSKGCVFLLQKAGSAVNIRNKRGKKAFQKAPSHKELYQPMKK